MKRDLDALKTEIQEYLDREKFGIFHGAAQFSEPTATMHWDTAGYPDFRQFLSLARDLKVNLVNYYHRELVPDFLDDLVDQLDGADLDEDTFVHLAGHVQDLRAYEGFTCMVELSFWFDGRLHLFNRRAPWYEELLDLADEIADYAMDESFDDEDEDMGRYFSKN